MKFAQLGTQRVTALPRTKAKCPCCGGTVIAKCGSRNVWHWAHKTKEHCDHWYERETQWHRDWKDQFPDNLQEVVHVSKDGERHVADVKTEHGLVIEFQHSYIPMEEAQSREDFYPELVWVVDGTRLKRDLPTFFDHVTTYKAITTKPPSYQFNYRVPNITARWMHSSNVVYFDFGDETLWQFTPFRGLWQGFAIQVRKVDFLTACIEGGNLHGYPVSKGLKEPDWMLRKSNRATNHDSFFL